jgi:hypothetical protein
MCSFLWQAGPMQSSYNPLNQDPGRPCQWVLSEVCMCYRVRRAEWSNEGKNFSDVSVLDQSLSRLSVLRIHSTKCIP